MSGPTSQGITLTPTLSRRGGRTLLHLRPWIPDFSGMTEGVRIVKKAPAAAGQERAGTKIAIPRPGIPSSLIRNSRCLASGCLAASPRAKQATENAIRAIKIMQ